MKSSSDIQPDFFTFFSSIQKSKTTFKSSPNYHVFETPVPLLCVRIDIISTNFYFLSNSFCCLSISLLLCYYICWLQLFLFFFYPLHLVICSQIFFILLIVCSWLPFFIFKYLSPLFPSYHLIFFPFPFFFLIFQFSPLIPFTVPINPLPYLISPSPFYLFSCLEPFPTFPFHLLLFIFLRLFNMHYKKDKKGGMVEKNTDWWKRIHNDGKEYRMMEKNTEWWKRIQNDGKEYRMMEKNTEWWKRIQNDGKQYRMMENNTEWWKRIQNDGKEYRMMEKNT